MSSGMNGRMAALGKSDGSLCVYVCVCVYVCCACVWVSACVYVRAFVDTSVCVCDTEQRQIRIRTQRRLVSAVSHRHDELQQTQRCRQHFAHTHLCRNGAAQNGSGHPPFSLREDNPS